MTSRLLPLAAALAFLTMPAQAQAIPALGAEDAGRLLERLDGNLEAIAGGGKPAAAILNGLAGPGSGQDYTFAEGVVEGLGSVSWQYDSSRPDQALIALTFADMGDATAFADGLGALAGVAPDAGCTNDIRIHWILADDLSLEWRLWDYSYDDYGWVSANLIIRRAPPSDVNCSLTTARPEDRIDQDELEDFFGRLRTDPPGFDDVRALEAWIAPYGKFADPRSTGCDGYGYVENPSLSGVMMLLVSLPACGDEGFPSAYLQLVTGEGDMFASDKISAAVTAALGEGISCHDPMIRYYPITKGMTLMITEMSVASAVMVYDAPFGVFGC